MVLLGNKNYVKDNLLFCDLKWESRKFQLMLFKGDCC